MSETNEEFKPSEEQKNTATLLLARLTKEGNHNYIFDRVERKEKSSGFKMKYWSDNSKLGITTSSASKHRARLRTIIDDLSIESANNTLKKNKGYVYTTFKKAIDDAQVFLDNLETLLNIDDEIIIKKNKKDIPSDTDFTGFQWYAYFLYYLPEDQNQEEPFLGRGIVNIGSYDFKGKNRRVQFLNTGVSVDSSKDYYGDYKPYLQIGVGSIIIVSLDSDVLGRELHIKLYCSNTMQKVMLGQYTTYENHYIQTGTILLQLVKANDELKLEKDNGEKLSNEEAKKFKATTGLFSFTKNVEEFKEIKKNYNSIVDFLTIKGQSYHSVYRGVYSLDSLRERMISESEILDKSGMFLEEVNPIVYISTPQTTPSNEKLVSEILSGLKRVVKDVEFKLNTKDGLYDDSGYPLPAKRLATIKKYRFFILVVESVTELSYSFIQFAWAMVHSKRAILICEEKAISKTIAKIGKLKDERKRLFDIISYKEKDSFDESVRGILENLIYEFSHNLPSKYKKS